MAELQRTYGNFKVYGEVQGLKRNYAFNDKPTKSGYDQNQLKFDVKTSEDNIVTVELRGMDFGNIRITPQDREDKQTKDLDRTPKVYDNIPEDWQVMMGVNVGLEQDEDGKNIVKEKDSYDAARYIHENLNDGDVVFISGRLEVNAFTNRNEEEVIQMQHTISRIYKSNKEFDPTAEDFKETSSFDQNLIIQAVDLDKKEKKAYVQSYLVYNKDKDFVPFTFWVDGNKNAKLAKNLSKLPFGTQMKFEGNLLSTVSYEEQEEETDEWGFSPSGYEKRAIKNVDKSYELTKGLPETMEKEKYAPEDFVKEEPNSDEGNPFANDAEEGSDEWGSSPNEDSNDPFSGEDW